MLTLGVLYFHKVSHIVELITFLLTGPFFPLSQKLNTVTESDHAPVSLDLAFPLHKLECPPWKLDRNLLADNALCELISQKIDDFIESNKKDNISPSLIWETLKAVIRGEIISYSTKINKMKRIKQEELIKSITIVDAQYSISPSLNSIKRSWTFKLSIICYQLKRQNMLKSQGDKAGCLLTHQLKCRSVSQQIPQIRK